MPLLMRCYAMLMLLFSPLIFSLSAYAMLSQMLMSSPL